MIPVTNNEGRFYLTDKKSESYYDDTAGKWCWRDIPTFRCVPNGMWVLGHSLTPGRCSWLAGITPDRLDSFKYIKVYLDGKPDENAYLYVSDKPFGYICADEEDVNRWGNPCLVKPNGRKTLVHARQIHKGELGSTVPIQRLKYVRQAFKPGTKLGMSARDRNRSNLGWVRLIDLAGTKAVTDAGLTVEDVVFGFWSYSGHRNSWVHNNDQDGGQLLDVIMASSPEDITRQYPQVHAVTQSQVLDLIYPSLRDMWVRRGFAYTVLRLLALGVPPDTLRMI